MGVAVRASDSNTISGNTIQNCFDESLFLEASSENYVYLNTVHCHGYTCGEGAVIIGHVDSNHGCAQTLFSDNNILSTNTISADGGGSFREGMSIYGDGLTRNNTLYNNSISGSAQHGIVISGAWLSSPTRDQCFGGVQDPPGDINSRNGHGLNTFSANTIGTVASTGIWVGSNNNNIVNNTVLSAPENGIYLDMPSTTMFDDCCCSGPGKFIDDLSD